MAFRSNTKIADTARMFPKTWRNSLTQNVDFGRLLWSLCWWVPPEPWATRHSCLCPSMSIYPSIYPSHLSIRLYLYLYLSLYIYSCHLRIYMWIHITYTYTNVRIHTHIYNIYIYININLMFNRTYLLLPCKTGCFAWILTGNRLDLPSRFAIVAMERHHFQ